MGLFDLVADVIEVATIPIDIAEDVLDLKDADLDIASTIRDEVTDSIRDLEE